MKLYLNLKSDHRVEPRDVASGIEACVNAELGGRGASSAKADEEFHPEHEEKKMPQHVSVTLDLVRHIEGNDINRLVEAIQKGAYPAHLKNIEWEGMNDEEET